MGFRSRLGKWWRKLWRNRRLSNFLSSKIRDLNLINQKKSELERMYSTHDLRSESISFPNLQHYGVSLDLFDEIKYKQHLKESFDKIYPLFYLDREQRKFI